MKVICKYVVFMLFIYNFNVFNIDVEKPFSGTLNKVYVCMYNIGNGYLSPEQFKNAVDSYGCAVEALNAVRSLFKSKDDWKIIFRELYETTYTGLWKSLLKIEKLEEALLAAERGRAQNLTDNLLIQYKLPALLLPVTIDLKETVSRLFTELSSTTLFQQLKDLQSTSGF